MPPTNGAVKRIILGVAITVIASLTLFGLYSSGRITALEEQVKSLRSWVDATRTDLERVRTENNGAHDKLMAEIKEQGKAQDAKFTEILKEIGRK